VIGSLSEGHGLDAKWNDVGLRENLWFALFPERRVAVGHNALCPLEIVSQQLLSVYFLLLRVEFNDSEFLLGDSSLWIESHKTDGEVLLAQQCCNSMLWAWTDIALLELMDDSAGDTVDQLDGDGGWVTLLGGDQREDVGIQVLVEELTICAEHCLQDLSLLDCRGH
jgi:hypothetical protein